jgi:hypothetical protein
VAIHYCGCSNQAPQALPNNLRLAVYYEVEVHLILNEDYPLQRTANLMVRKAVAA